MAKNKPIGSLDTNILIRLLVRDVPEQANRIEQRLTKGETFEIADSALLESVYVLEKVYELDRETTARNILSIVSNQQFNCNKALFKNCIPLYVQNSKLSIIDCALLVYARLNQATPLYTFDKELVKSGEGDVSEP